MHALSLAFVVLVVFPIALVGAVMLLSCAYELWTGNIPRNVRETILDESDYTDHWGS
jgi:hypothetical protein